MPAAPLLTHSENTQRDSSGTLLDLLETTVTKRSFRHSLTGQRKTIATAALLTTYATKNKHLRRAERMESCCERLWVGTDDEGPRIMVSRCKQRCCPECDSIRSRILGHTIGTRVTGYKHPKLVTLTLKWSDRSLRDQIRYLLHSFNRLRQSAVWKAAVKRGIYVIEITRHRNLGSWHVHLHVIIDATYLAHEWLKERWHKITGDSFIVDIRKADATVNKYLAKYVSKLGAVDLEPYEEWPYREEIAGLRMVASFGDERPINEREPDENGPTSPLAPLSVIIERAKRGDDEALGVIDALAARYPYLFGADATEPSPAASNAGTGGSSG